MPDTVLSGLETAMPHGNLIKGSTFNVTLTQLSQTFSATQNLLLGLATVRGYKQKINVIFLLIFTSSKIKPF